MVSVKMLLQLVLQVAHLVQQHLLLGHRNISPRIQHRTHARIKWCDAIVHHHHFAQLGVAGQLPDGLPMRHKAKVATVCG